ncbi:hypothetical protein [Candidatus Electronema sp. JC]|uniref:hypothetical protein n=1 Tax=Candidatus Electronema sp. JC TaxID=3401570 RepID=UPI003B43C55D
MAEEQMVRVNACKEQDEALVGKRVFLQRAAAALGVVAAAGLTGAAVMRSAGKAGGANVRARCAEEDVRQQRIMADKELIIMTEKEKRQMLDRILSNHSRKIS